MAFLWKGRSELISSIKIQLSLTTHSALSTPTSDTEQQPHGQLHLVGHRSAGTGGRSWVRQQQADRFAATQPHIKLTTAHAAGTHILPCTGQGTLVRGQQNPVCGNSTRSCVTRKLPEPTWQPQPSDQITLKPQRARAHFHWHHSSLTSPHAACSSTLD